MAPKQDLVKTDTQAIQKLGEAADHAVSENIFALFLAAKAESTCQ